MVVFNMFSFLAQSKLKKIHVIVYAIVLPITLIPATWNVDLLHDAVVMVPAGALVHGKVLYSDVYSIFGPLSSWINYLPLKTIGVYLIVSRILGAILFWVTSFLFFKILSKYIDHRISLAISITWLVTTNGFITLKFINNLNYRILVASFVMMAAITTRVELILSWLFILAFMVLFYKLSKLVYLWLTGGILFISIYILGLYITGVLPKFISSNIFYTKILADQNTPFKTAESLFYVVLPFLLWAVPALILIVIVKFSNRFTNFVSIMYFFSLTFIFMLVYSAYEQIIDKAYKGISFFRWLDLVMVNIPISYLGFILLAIPISLLIRFSFIRSRIDEYKVTKEFNLLPVYLASSMSTYLYLHNLSLSYAHAFAPIIILGLVSLWKDRIVPNSNVYRYISKSILFIIILSSSIFINNISNDHYRYETEFLKGMTDTSKEKSTEFDNKFSLVRSKYLSNDHFEFRCSEWLLVLNENYFYPNKFYYSSGKYNPSWCGLQSD